MNKRLGGRTVASRRLVECKSTSTSKPVQNRPTQAKRDVARRLATADLADALRTLNQRQAAHYYR